MPDTRTPAERSRDARIAALSRWAHEDPTANAVRGQRGLQDRFEREVDPDGVLNPAERARRAECARKAHMERLSKAGVAARQARAANRRAEDARRALGATPSTKAGGRSA